jgi:hypothetical protein
MRFSQAQAFGYGGSAGVVWNVGKWVLRGEASVLQYTWGFHSQATDMHQAQGGVDTIGVITTSIGYAP